MNDQILNLSFQQALDKKLKIVFTRHAKERLEQLTIDIREAIDLVVRAKQVDVKQSDYKLKKYGEAQNGIINVQNGPVVFILKIVKNSLPPHNDIILIITVSDQRTKPVRDFSNRQKVYRKERKYENQYNNDWAE